MLEKSTVSLRDVPISCQWPPDKPGARVLGYHDRGLFAQVRIGGDGHSAMERWVVTIHTEKWNAHATLSSARGTRSVPAPERI